MDTACRTLKHVLHLYYNKSSQFGLEIILSKSMVIDRHLMVKFTRLPLMQYNILDYNNYHPPMKLQEGNFFSHVSLPTGKVPCNYYPLCPRSVTGPPGPGHAHTGNPDMGMFRHVQL